MFNLSGEDKKVIEFSSDIKQHKKDRQLRFWIIRRGATHAVLVLRLKKSTDSYTFFHLFPIDERLNLSMAGTVISLVATGLSTLVA